MSSPTVVVLGGGPAGAVAALVLAREGLDTIVLEASAGPTAQSGTKTGTLLASGARPLLERLGLWSPLEPTLGRACTEHRCTWGSDEPTDAVPLGTFGAGWPVDRARLDRTLAAVVAEAGVDWRWGHHAVDTRWTAGHWRLVVEAPEALVSVEADFVVDATGRQARFARSLGVQPQSVDKLVGVVVTVGTDSDPPLKGILVEALPEGWWYAIPRNPGRVVVAYMTDGDGLRPSEVRSRRGWQTLLLSTTHMREWLTPYVGRAADPRPRIVPAGSVCLQAPSGQGWLSVGDAAVAFDPLSSQGLDAAMFTGYHGARAVADHLGGQGEALAAYDAHVNRMFEDTLDRLHEYYALEQRWPYERFWSRRHQRVRRDAPSS